jgi:hypothetical protein
MKAVLTPARRKTSTEITVSISSAPSASKTRADLVVILTVDRYFQLRDSKADFCDNSKSFLIVHLKDVIIIGIDKYHVTDNSVLHGQTTDIQQSPRIS